MAAKTQIERDIGKLAHRLTKVEDMLDSLQRAVARLNELTTQRPNCPVLHSGTCT